MEEVWKNVIGCDSRYQVSSFGRFKTIYPDREVISKHSDKNISYVIVSICIDGLAYTKPLHRLVAQVFIPNPENKPNVNHKDGNKSNTHPDNLEWCTQSENMLHAWKTGLNTGRRGKKLNNN